MILKIIYQSIFIFLELVNLLRLRYSYNHAINVSFIIIHNTTNIKLKLIITCMANRTFKLFTTTNHGFSKDQLDKNVYIDQEDGLTSIGHERHPLLLVGLFLLNWPFWRSVHLIKRDNFFKWSIKMPMT